MTAPLLTAHSRRVLHALKDLELTVKHFDVKYIDQEVDALRAAVEAFIAEAIK